ncbi:hypothetical protein KI387_043706 [Taxus chinensis]|uniref:non-specific serine/threonine protein kinase n=1 Tax=Taxus chinensis TaxID=29808 RepID=A0AA38H217_TAXCH|nr:hypothetical protein KI387_043706 [Taxus chinensis]
MEAERRWMSVLAFILVLFAAEARGTEAGGCPMNISAELDAHPWMYDQCFTPDKSHCCEGILDLIKIFHFSWLHSTRSFLLPDNGTADSCVHEFNQQLVVRGVDSKLVASCRLGIDNFITDSGTCNNITDLRSFQKSVDVSELENNCNSTGRFQCRDCVIAMGRGLNSLYAISDGGKLNCAAFVLMYVGGGINCYDALGPDAAYCILSVSNLSAVAAGRSVSPPHKPLNEVTKTVIVTLIPSLAVLIFALVGVFGYIRRLRSLREIQHRKLMRRYEILSDSTGLTFFNMSDIKQSTRNFSDSNLIGEGGFGMVYRGKLSDGSEIAVKRFKDFNKRADEEFSHEVQMISSTKHRNLLPLKGYSVGIIDQAHEQLLVYDLMKNGSLADYLFSTTRPCLTWPQRYKIAVGIARALAYLHDDTKPPIIHRDVKAANVLLDEDLSPLVADFGMAKFKKGDETHYTTRTVGTLGYVAPEYALYGHLNDKSDVFSFGIIVLELLTGRRAFNTKTTSLEHVLISDWVVDMTQKGRSEEIIDERIREERWKQSMERVLLVALQCAHPRVVSRPSISQALLILEAIDQPPPDVISALHSMELDLESSCNSRGDFTWLISPDTDNDLSSSSNSRELPV